MNFKHFGVVFKKEILDIIRDRRTLLTTLLLPMLIMPVLFFVMGSSMESIVPDETSGTGIGLTERANAPEVRARIEEMLVGLENIQFVTEDVEAALSDERVQVILDVPEDAQALLADQKPLPIQVISDESKLKSSTTAGMVSNIITGNADRVLQERLADQGIILDELRPATIYTADIRQGDGIGDGEAAAPGGAGNPFVSMIVPMLLAILLWTGGIGASCDMIAGEKERFTLEPLLATCANRTSLLTGKFFAVMVFMMMSLCASLIGMVLAFFVAPQFMEGMGGSMTLNLSLGSTLLTLLSVLALGMTFVAVQLALSALAKSMKQAQQWLSIMMLLIMVPAYATMFMQAGDVQSYMMIVPVLNAIASMKMVLGGVVRYDLLLIALASSAVFLGIALYATSRVFNREGVLFRA